jgi:hypothetical protein
VRVAATGFPPLKRHNGSNSLYVPDV